MGRDPRFVFLIQLEATATYRTAESSRKLEPCQEITLAPHVMPNPSHEKLGGDMSPMVQKSYMTGTRINP